MLSMWLTISGIPPRGFWLLYRFIKIYFEKYNVFNFGDVSNIFLGTENFCYPDPAILISMDVSLFDELFVIWQRSLTSQCLRVTNIFQLYNITPCESG